jgi:hypothetical protein
MAAMPERFVDSATELNKRIRLYNLKAPAAAFHRKHIDPDRIIAQIGHANC